MNAVRMTNEEEDSRQILDGLDEEYIDRICQMLQERFNIILDC
jgi:hypothetical protein